VEVSGPVTVNLMFVAIHQLMFLTFAEESQRKESKAERKRKAKLCRLSVDIVVVDGALDTPENNLFTSRQVTLWLMR